MKAKDYFSPIATNYACYRPDYPNELFLYLVNLTKGHTCAWDCATGNGQAAAQLANYFDQVIATDFSEQQLQQAQPKLNITYLVMPAEKTALADHSIDLITVAQALHWFDLDKFYQEVRRILKPAGILAAWCYNLLRINDALDTIIDKLYWDITGAYWDKKRQHIDAAYQTIAFPFTNYKTPAFYIEKRWSFAHVLGYLNTWSGLQAYKKAQGEQALNEIWHALKLAWGPATELKQIRWPIYLLVGGI
jgi:ubiquinone/menaquinone biosynthesis C-methylase UbiE